MNTSLRFVLALAIGSALLCQSQMAQAQSNQYKRATKQEKAPDAPVAPTGQPAPAAPGAPAAEDPNKKVDVSDLEQKYWAPKDTEFTVVQNRTYTKANRFALTASFGPMINDQYSKASCLGLTGNYYFSERMGVELSYIQIPSQNNIMTDTFINDYKVAPDHNKQRSFVGAAFNWIPVYAKISLLEKQILYFDMAISPGIGVMTYDHVQKAADYLPVTYETGATAFAYTVDVSQHLFINKNFGVRFDIKNQFYTEKVKSARTYLETRSQGVHNTIMLFGLTYYH